jgi:hypothetical protein
VRKLRLVAASREAVHGALASSQAPHRERDHALRGHARRGVGITTARPEPENPVNSGATVGDGAHRHTRPPSEANGGRGRRGCRSLDGRSAAARPRLPPLPRLELPVASAMRSLQPDHPRGPCDPRTTRSTRPAEADAAQSCRHRLSRATTSCGRRPSKNSKGRRRSCFVSRSMASLKLFA